MTCSYSPHIMNFYKCQPIHIDVAAEKPELDSPSASKCCWSADRGTEVNGAVIQLGELHVRRGLFIDVGHFLSDGPMIAPSCEL